MNEEQLRLFIRQAFALVDREDQIVKGTSPAFLRAMAQVRQLVGTLPPEGDLFREQAWRQLLPQIRNALRPYNEEFALQIGSNLIEEAPDMAEDAVNMLEAVGVPAAPQVPVAAAPSPFGRLPVADNVAAALRSKVNGKNVAKLFEQQGSLLLSDWMRSNERVINNVVTKGILDGSPTPDIADGIAQIIQRQGQEYINTAGPTAARRIQADAKAIARTAVQDANHQVHEEVWKANEEALTDLEWEWVAVLDARVCPICAPLDGERWPKRSDAPNWPAHVNCRCQVVAVNPDRAADVRSGIVIRDPKKGEPFKGDRAYKTKVKVDGKKYYRKAVDVKPIKGQQVTYGDFLHSSNQLTREKFFGSKAKANRFMELVDKRSMDPRAALKRLVDEGKFKPDVKLGKLPAVKVNKPKPKPSKPSPVVAAKARAERVAKAKAAAQAKAAAKAQAEQEAKAKQVAAAKAKAQQEAAAKAKAKAEAAALAKFKAEQAAVEKAKAEAKKAKAALEAEKAKQKAAAEAAEKKAAELAKQKAKAEAAAKKAAEAKAKAEAATKAAAAKAKPAPVPPKQAEPKKKKLLYDPELDHPVEQALRNTNIDDYLSPAQVKELKEVKTKYAEANSKIFTAKGKEAQQAAKEAAALKKKKEALEKPYTQAWQEKAKDLKAQQEKFKGIDIEKVADADASAHDAGIDKLAKKVEPKKTTGSQVNSLTDKSKASKTKSDDDWIEHDPEKFKDYGYSTKAEMQTARESVRRYTTEFNVREIREGSYSNSERLGGKLDSYGKSLSKKANVGGQQDATVIHDFLERAPKYEGQRFRGTGFDSEQSFMNALESYKEGKEVMSLESWSNDAGIAQGFADRSGNVQAVFHVAKNKKGVGISSLNSLGEDEILAPAGVRYRVLGVKRVEQFSGDDTPFSITKSVKAKSKKTLFEVELEEI